MALVLAATVALLGRAPGAPRPAWPPFGWVALAYAGASLPSALLSDDMSRSTLKWLLGLCHVALAWFTFLNVGSHAVLRRLARAWFVGTAVTVAVGLASLAAFYAGGGPPWLAATLSGYGSLPAGPYSRPGALFHQANPNSLCQYLSVSLLLLLPARRLGWLSRRATAALFVAAGGLALATLSHGVGGILLGIGAWLGWQWKAAGRPRAARAAWGLGVLAATLMFAAILVSPATGSGRGAEWLGLRIEPSARILCWETSWRTFVSHPLFGRGVGLQTACPDYVCASGAVARLVDAHSLYLSLASTQGLVGLVAYLLVPLVVLRRSWPLPAPRSATALAAGTLAIAVAQALFYQGLAGSYEFVRVVWLALGLLAAAQRLGEPPPAPR